jgi:uncharacterized protein (DUF1697 family)
MARMALVVFIRGANVGGHRTFRPSLLVTKLSKYDVVNVGAAGTFVVKKPGARAKFGAELRGMLPFEAVIFLCDGRDFLALESRNPFPTKPPRPDTVRFVSILSRTGRFSPSTPITIPETGQWLVRIIGVEKRLVFGEYRRHMKTIGYLGQMDKLFGVPATTRNWNTIKTVIEILRG